MVSIRPITCPRASLTNILARYETILNGTRETLTGLLLVTVVRRAVKKTVSRFYRVVNGLQL